MTLFKLYLSKLSPDSKALWQKPRSISLHYLDTPGYEPRAVSHDTLERFMKLSISKSVKMDGEYTNHSIRATAISTLDNDGFEAQHIMQINSHESESTIKEYATKYPENKRKEMFDSLSDALAPKGKKGQTNSNCCKKS